MNKTENTTMPPLCSVVRWHAVAEQMPDDDLTVMIHHAEADEPVWMGYYDGENKTWRNVDASRCAVSHWADLPDPPNMDQISTRIQNSSIHP